MELCGAGNRIQIYEVSPIVVQQVGNYSNIGCFLDSVSARVLGGSSDVDYSSTGMTVEKCVAFAQLGSWQYAGVEYGGYVFVFCSLTCSVPFLVLSFD